MTIDNFILNFYRIFKFVVLIYIYPDRAEPGYCAPNISVKLYILTGLNVLNENL
jgi:hypothetical protein